MSFLITGQGRSSNNYWRNVIADMWHLFLTLDISPFTIRLHYTAYIQSSKPSSLQQPLTPLHDWQRATKTKPPHTSFGNLWLSLHKHPVKRWPDEDLETLPGLLQTFPVIYDSVTKIVWKVKRQPLLNVRSMSYSVPIFYSHFFYTVETNAKIILGLIP